MRRILTLVLAMAVIVPLLSGTSAAQAASATGSPANDDTAAASREPAAFLDVPSSHPFAVDIDWMLAEYLATGYEDGTFRPSAPITRQGAAAFLYRYADAVNGANPPCSSSRSPTSRPPIPSAVRSPG